jgi:hypothetical protein
VIEHRDDTHAALGTLPYKDLIPEWGKAAKSRGYIVAGLPQ